VGASSGFSHESHRMTIIHHDQGAVFFCQAANPFQIRHDTIHGEYAIGCDHCDSCRLCLFELVLQIRHVTVFVNHFFGFTKPYSVDDAGVVEFIAYDRVGFREENFK
jgi:hypothetical protein